MAVDGRCLLSELRRRSQAHPWAGAAIRDVLGPLDQALVQSEQALAQGVAKESALQELWRDLRDAGDRRRRTRQAQKILRALALRRISHRRADLLLKELTVRQRGKPKPTGSSPRPRRRRVEVLPPRES